MPDEYTDAYLCLTLKVTYTELLKQPGWWVEDMVQLINTREKVKADQAKIDEARLRNKRR